MTYNKGWLSEQIRTANSTINNWSSTKREAMVREDLCPSPSSKGEVAATSKSEEVARR
jgi:hypothetical protein